MIKTFFCLQLLEGNRSQKASAFYKLAIAKETVKVLITPSKIFIFRYCTIKPVILAGMPESSATDGNRMIINNNFS